MLSMFNLSLSVIVSACAVCVCRVYCRAGVRGRGDSCSRRRRRTMLDVMIECDVKPACEVQIRANDRDTAK